MIINRLSCILCEVWRNETSFVDNYVTQNIVAFFVKNKDNSSLEVNVRILRI